MNKLLLITGLIFTTLALQAQPPQNDRKPPTTEEKMKKANEVIQKEVQPNTDQKKAIESAFKTFFAAEEKVRKDNPPPPPDPKAKAAMDKLVKERDEAIKKILTDAQYKKYVEAAKKLQPPPPGENGQGGQRPQRQE